jgi:hypothetical protein
MASLAILFKVFFLPTRHPVLVAHEPTVRFAVFVGAMVLATEMIARNKQSDLAQLQRQKEPRAACRDMPGLHPDRE